ncbi:SGNH/GDSL hydrolase family protein [Neobacillus vireti]|uniref:SGNH/GDSL hydrolase family protein n=1 Tax=Neobacillus vireti TaxID=220686 RepID=UPI002FFED0DC
MANYSPNLNLYLPSRNDSGIEVDLSLTENFNKIDTSLAEKANKTELMNIGNGSPKGAYATLSALQTDFPTGTSGIYVVSADGKWYFWNGSVWTAGGIYQSTALADGTVTPEKTTFANTDVYKYVKPKNILDMNSLSTGVLNSSGAVDATNTSYKTTNFISVFGLGNIYCSMTQSGSYVALKNNVYCFYDSNKTFISGTYTANWSGLSASIAIPSNAYYIRLCGYIDIYTGSAYANHMIEAGTVRTTYEIYFTPTFRLNDKVVSNASFADSVRYANLIKNTNINLGYSSSYNTVKLFDNKLNVTNTAINSAETGFNCKLDASKVYAVVAKVTNNHSTNALMGLSRSFKSNTGVILDTTYLANVGASSSYTDVVKIIRDSTEYLHVRLYYSMYSATAMDVNFDLEFWLYDITNENDIQLVSYREIAFNESYSLNKSLFSYSAKKVTTGFEGKTLSALGDSITAQEKWYDSIKKHFGFKTINDHGIGGTCIAGTNPNAMWQDTRINAIKAADIISVMGGTNDWTQNIPLGTLSLSNTDTNSFTGAFNVLLNKLVNKYQTTPIVIFSCPYGEYLVGSLPSGFTDITHNSLGLTSKDYADRAIAIAELWGLPHANMQLCGINSVNIANFFTGGDHIHIDASYGYMYAKKMIPAIQSCSPITGYY